MYDQALGAIVLEANGEMSVEFSKAMIDAEVEMLEKHKDASILYCQGETSNDLTGDDIFAISEYSAKLGELLEGKKMAVVLQDDLDYGLGRMWKSFTEVRAPFEIQLFRDRDKAEKWISE